MDVQLHTAVFRPKTVLQLVPNKRHRAHTEHQTNNREDLPPNGAAPHHRVHDEVARQHLHARRVDEHARAQRRQEGLRRAEGGVCVRSGETLLDQIM